MKALCLALGLMLGMVVSAEAQSITNDLTWEVPLPGGGAVDNYLVERSADGGAFAQVATIPAPGLSYQDAGLAVGPIYTWQIRAQNAAGTSGPSGSCSSVTLPPNAPQSLSCTVTFIP